jgi:mono/diheme cytochrome c family protein
VRRLIVSLAFLFTACAPPPPKELEAKGGAQIYAKLCSSCHAPDGRSLATVAPPLAGHAVRILEAGGRTHMIQIVLNGMSGPIEVGGRRYDAIMTPLRYLKDQQVADILNFVLTSWGNGALLPKDFKEFTPQEIHEARDPVMSPKDVAASRPALAPTP